jgi:hypothetical protein
MRFAQLGLRMAVGVLVLLPCVALCKGERELVTVLAAKMRHALLARGTSPDLPPNIRLTNPNAQSAQAESTWPPIDAELQRLLTEAAQETADLERENADLASQVKEMRVAQIRMIDELTERDAVRASASRPFGDLAIDLLQPVGEAAAPYQMDVYTADWCLLCQRAKERDGDGDGRIHLRWVESRPPQGVPVRYPAYYWRDGKGEYRYAIGVRTLDQLVDMIERNDPPETRLLAASGPAGSIRTGGRIRAAFDVWRNHLGEGTTIKFRGDRTGPQKMSVTKLMHGELWTVEQVTGKFGHVSVSTTSDRVPVQSLGFSYHLTDKRRFSIDLDAVDIALPESHQEPSAAVGAACGIDPITISMTLLQIGSALYQMLNPQVDLGLGGTIEAAATLSGDTIVCQFTDGPSIHVAAWFKFDLEVQAVEVTESKVLVRFKPQPQNWIRIDSREFAVDDSW